MAGALVLVSCMLAPGGAGAAAPGNTPSTGGNVVSGRLCSGYDGCDAAGMPSHDYSSGYYTSWWDMDPGDECTNYVAYVESTVYGVPTPDYELGNAADWPAAAAANGVVVNSTPTVGSVAVWNPYSPGIGPLGHVAVVEEVGPRNSWIVISQQHLLADADGYEWTRLNPNEPGAEWEAWPNYFIHFRGDLPFEASLDAFAVSVRGPSLASVAPLVRGLAAQAPEIGPEMKSPTVTTVEGMIADDQQQVTAATNTAESVLAAPALAYQLTWPTALWSLALDAEQALTFAAPDHPAPQILAAHDPLGAQ